MTTIYVKTDEELKEAINKYGKGTKIIANIVDERPNNNKDQELERHIDAVEEERIEETGQL